MYSRTSSTILLLAGRNIKTWWWIWPYESDDKEEDIEDDSQLLVYVTQQLVGSSRKCRECWKKTRF